MFGRRFLQIGFLFLLFYPFSLCAQSDNNANIPVIVKDQNGNARLRVDGKPFLILGAQLWNSSAWPYILDKALPRLKKLHCNTLEAPVYWQTIEPRKNNFNFSEVDSLVMDARKAGLKLILLWFGSYKNGSSQYAPVWVLSHPETYKRVYDHNGNQLQVLSPLCPENLQADEQAFRSLMKHLVEIDRERHTVIMVQVENEPGILGTDRDYSEWANKKFEEEIPAFLSEKLYKSPGNWRETFGTKAAEAFSAYYIAKYVNEVAKAGKKVCHLPMYTNVWLPLNGFRTSGEYPSGGAVPAMLPLWKATATQLSFFAPDIYQENQAIFTHICNNYSSTNNPLFIPEMGKGSVFEKEQFCAIADYHAIGVGVYGVDTYGNDPNADVTKKGLGNKLRMIADNYRLINGAMTELAALQSEDKLTAVVADYGVHNQLISMGDYSILFSFGQSSSEKPPLTGRAIIGQIAENEFLLMGFNTKFEFKPRYGSPYSSCEYLMIEEGYYKNGEWVRKRIWNGDQAYFSTLTTSGNILQIHLRKVK